MQRNVKKESSSQKKHPLIAAIQNAFYQDLANLMVDVTDVNENNIDFKIKQQIKCTIIRIFDASSDDQKSIVLPTGEIISKKNCPLVYLPILGPLIKLKHAYELQGWNEQIDDMLTHIAGQVMSAASFQENILSVKQFILEAMGKDDGINITPQLIRDTFYNEMVNQTEEAVFNNWISVEDLEAQETYIFFALSALTLIEAAHKSRNIDGMRLLNNQVLTMKICPKEEGFPELAEALFSIKDSINQLSDNDLNILKQFCLDKSESTVSDSDVTLPIKSCARWR